MDLAVVLAKQVGILLLALGICWGTKWVIKDALVDSARDIKRAKKLLREGGRK